MKLWTGHISAESRDRILRNTYPPVKQNWFQLCTMPLRKLRLCVGCSMRVKTMRPLAVVTPAGSYHSCAKAT
jgi:hypothetical protein